MKTIEVTPALQPSQKKSCLFVEKERYTPPACTQFRMLRKKTFLSLRWSQNVYTTLPDDERTSTKQTHTLKR
jgi:hypothetical protein